MSSPVCFLCFQAIDTTTPTVEESRTMRISFLGELLSRKKFAPQFAEDESLCELCPVCAPEISEMEHIRDQISVLEEQIGMKITKIREIILASNSKASSLESRDRVMKLRTSIFKMMGDNDDQQDDDIVLADEVLIKVEQDDEDQFQSGGYDHSFDDQNSPFAVDLNNEEDTVPVKYEGDDDDDDFDESAFCINPHPQRRGRGRPPKSAVKHNLPRNKRKLARPRLEETPAKIGPTPEKRIKVENNLLPAEPSRRSTRTRKTTLPPKGVNKTLTVSLERIPIPVTKSSPISSPSSSPFHEDEDTKSSHQDYLPSDLELQSEHKPKIRPHKCFYCVKSFLAETTLSHHIARFHFIRCPDPHCDAAFSTVKAKDAHRKVAHPRVPTYERVEGGTTRAQSTQVAERVLHYYKNEANRDSKKTCKFFEQQGVPKSSVYSYLRRFKDEDIVKFKKPPGRPRWDSETRRPAQSIPRPFKCTSCSKSFIHRYALFNHVARDHTRAKEQVCHICGKACYTVFDLRKHLRKHDESLRPKCETCGEVFMHGGTLQSHRIREHGADPLVCDECGATFVTLKGFKEHKWSHTGIKPYKCDQCDALFSKKHQLKAHLLSHSDQRPHPCPHCDRAFKMKTKLSLHIKQIHTAGYVTPTPFKCSQCERSFQYPGLLKAHVLQAHTEERPLTCDQCGKGFVLKTALTLHLKGKHGIEVAPVIKNRLPRSKRDTFLVEGGKEGDP